MTGPGLQVELVDLLDGDHLAALMYGQILYWYAPSKSGHSKLRATLRGVPCLAKSSADWWSELRLTKKQAHRCLQVLRDKGLVTTEVHLFAGKTSVFVQLIAQPKCPTAPPEVPVGTSWECPQELPVVPVGTAITETTTETTTEIQEAQAQPQKEQQVNVQDTLKAFEEKSGKKPSGTNVMAMVMLWKKHMGLTSQGFVKSLTGKEVGQLKIVHTKLGDQAIVVLEYALEHWQKFAMEVQVQKAAVPAMTPVVGFFAQHFEVALQLIAKPKVKSVVTPPQLNLAAVPKVEENADLATEADVQETLAQLAALKKGPEK